MNPSRSFVFELERFPDKLIGLFLGHQVVNAIRQIHGDASNRFCLVDRPQSLADQIGLTPIEHQHRVERGRVERARNVLRQNH